MPCAGVVHLLVLEIMSDTNHLLVVEGEETGRKISVPAEGARLGRSSTNDIVVLDPMLSRHHCRLYFRLGDGLWISDLGSVNQTLVDDEPITDVPLRRGSRITVGDTIISVEDDGRAAVPSPVEVDLGLGSVPVSGPTAPTGAKRPMLSKLIFTAALAVAALVAAWVGKAIIDKPQPLSTIYTPDPQEWTLAVSYEKVEANRDRVFRYDLTITPDHRIAIEIDDPQHNRNIREADGVDPELLRKLAEDLLESGFYDLDPEYRGIQPGVYNQYSLRITVGKDTHRVVVLNRPEPAIFEKARERIENFGRVELEIWSPEFTVEKLLELAADAQLSGEKLYREKAMNYGNLAAAIKTLRESAWYLETVSPKPDFLADVIELRKTCESELEQHHIDQNFRAVRAMETRDWSTASTELRIILEMIPSRDDQRHRDAREKLKEVDARIEREK
jgi:hypothetical protein